jgi:choline dehydrogenase-like flavoprotein
VLSDARSVPPGSQLQTDICIIGGGVAGITIARELGRNGVKCTVLESGGFDYEAQTQQLYTGEIMGLPYSALHVARLRYFGGTSNHWSGWCRALDDFDFARHEWIPHSGWPFGRAELLPFYARAFEILQTGPTLAARGTPSEAPAEGLKAIGPNVANTVFWLSPPTRLGSVYRENLVRSPTIELLLHANVTEIVPDTMVRRIERVRVRTLSGTHFEMRARLFVLAAGGIENPRLLLLSSSVQREGLGNARGLVGRFFMDHAGLQLGSALLTGPRRQLAFYQRHTRGMNGSGKQVEAIGAVTFSAETLARERMTNCCLLLQETSSWEAMGLLSAAQALKRGETEYLETAVRSFVHNLDDAFVDLYTRHFNEARQRPLLALVTMLAPMPNPDSRVTLGQQTDELGLRRVELHWQLSDLDKLTVRRAHDVLGTALGAGHHGRILTTLPDNDTRWPPLIDWQLQHGWHHMGTTRMHEDPTQGVVDARCRVHGLDNLYLAGSSVFPTYGFSQPTLTIVALALRIAEDLRDELR